MERKLIETHTLQLPSVFDFLLNDSVVYDSSCSNNARVLYFDKDKGYFLKIAPKGTLARESKLAGYFHSKQLTSRVVEYVSEEMDWLLTEKVEGEDCVWHKYLEAPEKLCDVLSEILIMLHETVFDDYSERNWVDNYINVAYTYYCKGIFDASGCEGKYTAEEAWNIIERNKNILKSNELIHGDFCLPNIILKDWKFNGFIDLGNAGVGDRHIDLYWCNWSLMYNLKTEKYKDRLFDAYGRYRINKDALKLISIIELFG